MKTRFIVKDFFGPLRRLLMKLPEKNVVLILSLVVGLSCGCAAVLLKSAVEFIHHGLTSWFDSSAYNYLYLVYPGVGMLIAMLFVKYVIKDNIGHGVTKVLVAISKNESKIKPHNMWSSIAASSVTIGFGGSVGAEAPIVYTGAAIGSNVARYMGLSYKSMTILLGCGAAGAVAGIFKAPLAGVLFTLEILLFNISMSSILPLLLSTISATVVSYIFLGSQVPFECELSPFSMGNMPFYLVLGVFCALFSVYFTRMTLWLEDKIKSIKRPMLRWGLAACCLLCNEFDLALALSNGAFKLNRGFYGENHHETAANLNLIAQAHEKLGDYTQAIEAYTKAIDIIISLYGNCTTKLIVLYYNLADCKKSINSFTSALQNISKALEIIKKTIGDNYYDIDSYIQLKNEILSHIKEQEIHE